MASRRVVPTSLEARTTSCTAKIEASTLGCPKDGRGSVELTMVASLDDRAVLRDLDSEFVRSGNVRARAAYVTRRISISAGTTLGIDKSTCGASEKRNVDPWSNMLHP
jgi:hypothetical protein